MAKRFADTALSRKAWYRKLDPTLKCAWRFLCDECDLAGVWSIDEEGMAFHVFGKAGRGIELVTLVGAVNADGKVRLARVGRDKLLLVGFVVFQYGELSEDCKPHQAVIKRLRELELYEGYLNGFKTLPGRVMDKEKEKDKEKEEGGLGGDFTKPAPADFDAFWQRYPRKIDKAEARDRFHRLIKTPGEVTELRAAVERFRAHHEGKGTDAKYIPHPATFLGTKDIPRWRDWLDPANGTSDLRGQIPGGHIPDDVRAEMAELEKMRKDCVEGRL